MTASDKSSNSLTNDDIRKAVETLKQAPVREPLILIAPNELFAKEWSEMYPGVTIYLNGEVYDNQ